MSSVRVRNLQLVKRFFSQSSTPTSSTDKPKKANTDAQVNTNVTGLTSYVIKQKAEPLGPGASISGTYKVPEYFCYDRFSYHGAEIELAKYRCPQPSAVKSGKN